MQSRVLDLFCRFPDFLQKSARHVLARCGSYIDVLLLYIITLSLKVFLLYYGHSMDFPLGGRNCVGHHKYMMPRFAHAQE